MRGTFAALDLEMIDGKGDSHPAVSILSAVKLHRLINAIFIPVINLNVGFHANP